MRIKLNKNILILVTVILLSVSLVAAVYVFMSADKTITNGQSASFTCTIDPMLGSTSYDIRLIGNGINKLLKSGTGSSSVFNVPITVTPANYNNQAGDYIVQCHAKETSCDPCCCDEDTQTANLKVKPAPYCGDGSVGTGETCELPNTNNNNYCSQSASQCSGTKLGTRDAFGNCNNVCGCTFDPFNYKCVKGQCGAACDSNDDCNDGNSHTTDTCLNDCTCKHENIPYCGDGSVGTGETCELPNTNNNNYCGQSTSQCSGTKLGTRDSYGNCDGVCGCTYDSFNYQCVKGQCGATCAVNADCDDQNIHTTDTCLANCTCKHENIPYCGDGSVGAGETCELPNTNDNSYCGQTASQCSGTKLGARDAFGNCNNVCGCTYDPFNYACVKGQCGATCDSNDDCNDGNAYTTDLCLANCTCQHTTQPYCGDGGVSAGETCELPSTNNNTYCSQSTSQCSGTKLGIRDAYGNCNSTCGCKYDSYNYACVKGQCGATCANNADCDDGNSNTADTCLTNCTCKHTTQPYCGDGIIQTGEQCELTGAYAGWGEYGHEYTCNANNTYKHCVNCQYEQVNECKYYCSGDSECDGKAPLTYLESCTTFGFNYLQDFCNENCELEDNNCEDDYNGCTAEPECDEFAPNTGDCNYMCEYKPSPVCGNNIIDSGETCELPNTANNTYCGQTTQECLGTKLGTRDALGNCGNSCGCTYDPFNYACVKDQCGATCDSNDDCDDGNIHTLDTCLANCTCKHNTQDYCGDGIIQAGEQCDLGTSNGVVCTPPYEGSCTYCAANCTNITLTDGYCGDGVVDVPYEECDDGNDVDDDRCSNECEKAPCFNVSLSLDYAHLEIWCGPYPSKNVTAEALFSDNIYARQDSCNGSKEEVAYIYMYWYDVEKVNLSEVKAFLEHKENQALIWLEYYNGTKWKLVCDLSESGSDALNNCQVTLTQGVVDIALRLGVERTVLTGAYEDLDWAYIDLKYCDDPALWMKYDVPTAAATTQTTRHHSSGGGGGGGGSYTTTSTWNCTEWSECDDGKQTRSCKQGIFSKTESQNCTEVILTATTATTSTSAQAAVEEQEDEAEPETGDQTASISFKIGDEDEQETGGNPFLSGENKNDITGLTAGIGKALSSFSINWYAIAIILLIVLCLPVIFHFVTKK